MAEILTIKYSKHKDFYENLNANYDRITTKALSYLLYLEPDDYKFHTTDRKCYGIRFITYNLGKSVTIPVIAGILIDLETKERTRVLINNEINCRLTIIPVRFIVNMFSNISYKITIDINKKISNVSAYNEDDDKS